MAAESAGVSGAGLCGPASPQLHLPRSRPHPLVHSRRGRHYHLKSQGAQVVQTVLTCHGDLTDPQFPDRLSSLLDDLAKILNTGKDSGLRVTKLEPWNSVRVTLTIPREAAHRLRALAQAGDAALQALGILSVQLDGDQVISLRLTARFGGEPQEIVLRTADDGSSPSNALDHSIGHLLSSTGGVPQQPCTSAAANASVPGSSGVPGSGAFRSPNVVAPGGLGIPPSPRPHVGPSPYPFTSMTHAAQTQHSRDSSHHNFTAPPPYPAKTYSSTASLKTSAPSTPSTVAPTRKTVPAPPSVMNHQNTAKKLSNSSAGSSKTTDGNAVSLSSPLLVNLLQKDGVDEEPSRGVSVNGKRAAPIRHRPVGTLAAQQRPHKSFQQSQPQPIVSATSVSPAPSMLSSHRFPSSRPVIQGYSQFTASSSKPSTSSDSPIEKAVENSPASSGDAKKLIINPLTGELEPMPSESSESEEEPLKEDPFLYSSSPASRVFSDDDSTMSRRNDTSDQSDSEATNKSTASDTSLSVRRRPPALCGALTSSGSKGPEKIKLRLKLEKTEAYSVDLSFAASASAVPSPSAGTPLVATSGIAPPLKKPMAAPMGRVAGPGSSVLTPPPLPSPGVSSGLTAGLPGTPGTATEEPRVPPLHISLRGRNAAVVVSNRKEKKHWSTDEPPDPFEMNDVDSYGKLAKKKVKPGRDPSAIHNSQKSKKMKLKRLLDVDNLLKLKLPVVSDEEDKSGRKKKDSKKKNNVLNANKRHGEERQERGELLEEGNSLANLKMDSEEWISRTLKEESLNCEKRQGYTKLVEEDGSGCRLTDEGDDERDERDERTTVLELSDLLRRKNSKKCLKVVKLVEKDVPEDEAGREESEGVAKKPKQEIGGKIKSELSSKIDRVSGKLKNDLSVSRVSKDTAGKKAKFDESSLKKSLDKVGKGVLKNKLGKKDGLGLRLGVVGLSSVSSEGEEGEEQVQQMQLAHAQQIQAFARTKRRHSGDQSVTESQAAQKVKSRSSSSDQIAPKSAASHRFDVVSRKMRKDSVMDRLRKEKMGRVFGLRKLSPAYDPHSKLKHVNRVSAVRHDVRHVATSGNSSPLKDVTTLPTTLCPNPLSPGKQQVVTSLEPETKQEVNAGQGALSQSGEGGESPANGNGNGQGEDSGIESMDALSEKSPNQGESPCRKEESHHGEEKKGQNHDRTKDEEVKECLTEETEANSAQAEPVPFQTSVDRAELGDGETVGSLEAAALPCNPCNPCQPCPPTSPALVSPLAATTDPSTAGVAGTVVESFESKIREAFLVGEGLGAKMLEMEGGATGSVNVKEAEPPLEKAELGELGELGSPSPSLDDMERFRVNPPLYTYAKREDSLSPSPPTVEGTQQSNHMDADPEPEPIDEDSNVSSPSVTSGANSSNSTNSTASHTGNMRKKAKSNVDESARNKSLLEQLLIEIPGEETRRTRSWHRLGNSPGGTPKSSPRSVKDDPSHSPNPAKPSPRTTPRPSPNPAPHRGKRKTVEDQGDAARPSKRKCSENAAELIKACMGVEEKKQEGGKGVKSVQPATATQGKKNATEAESSDDEPLIDLAGKATREQSVENEVKNRGKQGPAATGSNEESRNNSKPAAVKVDDTKPAAAVTTGDQTATRRSARQSHTQNKTGWESGNRRCTRNNITQEVGAETGRRRRTSRDTK